MAPYFELNQEIHSRIPHGTYQDVIALAKSLADRLRRARYVKIYRRPVKQAIAEHAVL